eukprot:6212122-Pleurochrysis_carterae.AAC.2
MQGQMSIRSRPSTRSPIQVDFTPLSRQRTVTLRALSASTLSTNQLPPANLLPAPACQHRTSTLCVSRSNARSTPHLHRTHAHKRPARAHNAHAHTIVSLCCRAPPLRAHASGQRPRPQCHALPVRMGAATSAPGTCT